jgi:hypothetical protein
VRFAALCIHVPMCTPCVPLYSRVYPCVPLYSRVYPCVPLCTPRCTRLLLAQTHECALLIGSHESSTLLRLAHTHECASLIGSHTRVRVSDLLSRTRMRSSDWLTYTSAVLCCDWLTHECVFLIGLQTHMLPVIGSARRRPGWWRLWRSTRRRSTTGTWQLMRREHRSGGAAEV